MIFEWKELMHKKWGTPVAGCWAWHYGTTPMCDHEHDEFDPTCEDATIEMSNIRAQRITRGIAEAHAGKVRDAETVLSELGLDKPGTID